MTKADKTAKLESSIADLMLDLRNQLEELKEIDEKKYNDWVEASPNIQNFLLESNKPAQELFIPLNALEVTGLTTTLERMAEGQVDSLKLGNFSFIFRDQPLQAYTLEELERGSDYDIDDNEEEN